MLTKTVLAAALVIGSVSATLAKDDANKTKHARASYAQAQDKTSPTVDPTSLTLSTGAVRPLTPFEKNWFDFQNHQ
jgi:hypothetical protein